MSLPVALTVEAVDELRDASAWYEDRSAGLGLVFVAAVDRAVDRVARWPQAGVPVEGVALELQVRKVPVARFHTLLPTLCTRTELRSWPLFTIVVASGTGLAASKSRAAAG